MKPNATLLAKYYADPVAWRSDLQVRCAGSMVRFGEVQNQFQDTDFRAMDPAWERLLGKNIEVPHARAIEVRPRGHSKTQDAAMCSIRALAFARKKLTGIAASGDKDQADFLKDAHERLIADNPYLGDVLEVQRDGVVNNRTGSRLTVISSDVLSSWGHLFDYAILDELPTWSDSRGEGLWHSLFSASDKQPNWTVLLVIGNSGFRESWQWPIVEDARTHDDWYYNSLPGPVASWIDETALARQRRGLPDSVFNRVWMNEWASGSGDALSPELIAVCTNASAGPMFGDEPGFNYVAGLDLAISHDKSALCALGIHHARQRVKLAACEVWAPGPSRKIDLEQVKLGVQMCAWQFEGVTVAYDPHQCELMAQQLQREGVNMVAMPFTGKNCNIMASAVLQVFRDRAIELYPDPELIRDLGKLRLEERSYGWKLEAPRDRSGHADLGTAFAIATAMIPQALASYEPPPPDDGLDSIFNDPNFFNPLAIPGR